MNTFIMESSVVRPATNPYGRLERNSVVGYEGEHNSRSLVVETTDDLSAYASVSLIIDDLDCGAMTKTTSGSKTVLSLTLTSAMIGASGRKLCQLLMVESNNTVIAKSSQFVILIKRSNDIERSVEDGVSFIIISEAVTEMAQEAASAAAQEAAADVVADCQAIADAASASADAAAQSASDAQTAAASIVVDSALDATSTHALQNKVVTSEINALKADLEDLDERVEVLEAGDSGSGLTADVKVALLQILSKVAYIDEHGQDYYDALENALNPSVNLSSITCVYTQGGTVYDTDDLNDLKADLVVTAHYSDNTSEAVNAYILSGTLEVGTSIITVTYSTKTTTFDVVVTADPDRLPDGYTRLDYVWAKNTSSKPIYISTGYTPSASTEIEYKFSRDTVVPNSETTGFFTGHLCSCNGYYTPFLRKQKNHNQTIFANRAGHESDMVIDEITADTPFIIKAYTSDIGSDAVSKDGTTISTSMTAGSSTPSGTFSLFTYNGSTSSNYLLAGKLYYFKISENGTLVRNYIPCKNSSNVVGLYDTINDTFNPSSTANPLSEPE